MRVIFDCFKQVKGVGKSIGIYNMALNLIANIIKVPQKKDVEYIVLGNKYNRDDFSMEGVQFYEVNKDPLSKIHCIYWELFGVSTLYKKLNGDVIVFPRGFTTLFHKMNDVIIVHDLIPFYYHKYYPKEFNKLENAYIMNRLKASIKSANHIVTISNASRQDILNTVKVNPNKITVINNGVNRIESSVLFHENYIVAMTSVLPHKNARGIVESYKIYVNESEAPLPIVIIGIDDAREYGATEEINSHITCYKFIKSNQELHEIIGKAKMFLFLSEVEGFGFPPIEAMELGVPVICSNCDSLTEVVDDAALLTDPQDYKNVAEIMIKLLSNEILQQELVLKGYENIKRFAWDIIAEKYHDLLCSMKGT